MKKRWLGTIAALAIATLAVGAVPAFTTDVGTINLTITAAEAPAEPAPCIEVIGTGLVDFGTAPFNPLNEAPEIVMNQNFPGFRNCNTQGASEDFYIQGSIDAKSPSGTTWTLSDTSWTEGEPIPVCTDSSLKNVYMLHYFPDTLGQRRLPPEPSQDLAFTSVEPGEAHAAQYGMFMPCVGSDGAGETFALSMNLTAVIP